MRKTLPKKSNYRIALIGDFKEDTLRATQIIGRKIHKGFIRNGHDVQLFSYRQHLLANTSLPGKTLARKLATKKTNKWLIKLLKDYQPDLVLLLAYRVVDHELIADLKKALPNAVFAGWFPDLLDYITGDLLKINSQFDAFMATGAGDHLAQAAQRSGNIPAAFMPNPCDPDIEHQYPGEAAQSNLFFTGKYSHSKGRHDGNRERLLKTLIADYGLTIHGNGQNPAVLGIDYFRAISNAKIAISINIINDVRMYHSDRLINYMGCGVFSLVSYVPDSDLLFENKKHLCYFQSNEECIDLIKYYLDHDQERQSIAAAGMAHAHQAFHCHKIAKDIIDFLTTGTYDQPWCDVYNV